MQREERGESDISSSHIPNSRKIWDGLEFIKVRKIKVRKPGKNVRFKKNRKKSCSIDQESKPRINDNGQENTLKIVSAICRFEQLTQIEYTFYVQSEGNLNLTSLNV